ncbi:alpha/beta fold hydrolase [Candidatus Roizmanbacteria bacterium]|nr:alpha/beta fold hydrolase [Candidatus Roizmanbacteria bacterium]
MVKKVLLLGIAVIVLLGIVYLLQDTNTSKEVKMNPYSILALQRREFKTGKITVEETLGDSETHTSSIVSYPSDSLKIYALMNIPNSTRPQNGFPVVIINHGYINPSLYSTRESYRRNADFYAAGGYLVLKPDYRAHGKSEGERSRVLNRINYTVDVLNLIAAIPSIPQADPQKVLLWGHSMGGEISLRVLEITDRVKGATLWAPATTTFPESFLYFIRKNRPDELDEIEKELYRIFNKEDFQLLSSTENLKFIQSPLIIHHGKADESVPYSWSVELDKKLSKSNIRHTFYTYEGEDHNFGGGSMDEILMRDLAFFREALK